MNKAQITAAYREMLRIRLVEGRLVKEYLDKNIRSFVHFYIGQEAIAVGVCMHLKKKDYVVGTHRCHGHYLAKGGDLKAMIAELYGKATGCSGGRGGSMHLIDLSVGYMGSISILASLTSIATGMAFEQKKYSWKNVTVAFVGDGAADEGGFYESINLAALMNVPIIFVVENNLYAGMSAAEARHSKRYDLGKIVEGLGVWYWGANGNNIEDVYHKMHLATVAVKATSKEICRPAVIECMTYRHMAHSAPLMDDKAGYRKIDDLKTRQKACPLRSLIKDNNFLLEDGLQDSIEQEIRIEIDEAIRFAEESPMPDPEDLVKGVYHG